MRLTANMTKITKILFGMNLFTESGKFHNIP